MGPLSSRHGEPSGTKRVLRHDDTSLSDTKMVPFHHGVASPQIPYGIEGFYVDVEGRSKLPE